MKKIIALFLIISTLAVLILSMTSCGGGGGLSGTYSSTDEMFGIEVSYKFSGGNKVTMSTFGMSFDGTYKIEGNEITIKFTMFGETSEESYSFEQVSDKVIIIDGSEYTKK